MIVGVFYAIILLNPRWINKKGFKKIIGWGINEQYQLKQDSTTTPN